MKYLFQQQETRDVLRRWSRFCILGVFFFSHAVTTEQKSQNGLARTLLYQVLISKRQLIPQLLPAMWKESLDAENDKQHAVSLPSWSEIMYAFSVLTKLSGAMGNLRFCFFIDGLDEFDGDVAEGIEFIRTMAANPRIKVVLSSRPVPECVNAFDRLPSLHLHHLTRNEIVAYVQNRLGGDQYMERLVRNHRREAEDLIKKIADKAAGVFLWVILACRLVLSGFADCDRISELRRRVGELPPELEVLFEHMLGSVDRRHREQGARLLRMCYENLRSSGSDRFIRVSTLGLALFDDEIHQTVHVMSSLTFEEKADYCKDMDGRLRSRCGGLLEVKLARYGIWDEIQGFAGNAIHAYGDRLVHSEVVFMHRTVYEFLGDSRVWQLECLAMPADGRSVAGHLSLLGSYEVMLAVAEPPSELRNDRIQRNLDFGLFRGKKSDEAVPEVENNIFSTLMPILGQLRSQPTGSERLFERLAASSSSDPHGCQHTPLLVAVEAGARNFARKHLSAQVDGKCPRFRCGCLPPLYHAVRQPLLRLDNGGLQERHGSLLDTQRTISTLLAQGCNPNEVIESCLTSMTPWSAWLSEMDHVNITDESEALIYADIVEAFLEAGASATRNECEIIWRTFPCRDPSAALRERGERLRDLLWNTYQVTCRKRSSSQANSSDDLSTRFSHKIYRPRY